MGCWCALKLDWISETCGTGAFGTEIGPGSGRIKSQVADRIETVSIHIPSYRGGCDRHFYVGTRSVQTPKHLRVGATFRSPTSQMHVLNPIKQKEPPWRVHPENPPNIAIPKRMQKGILCRNPKHVPNQGSLWRVTAVHRREKQHLNNLLFSYIDFFKKTLDQ